MLTALMDQKRAAGAWLLGGSPLVVSSLQSVSALSGNTALYWIPGIGSVSRMLTSLPIVVEAARIFYSQTTVVLLLFLLIAAAWVAQGVLMFTTLGRKKPYSKTGSAGAVVLSGLLYGFLFIGIYSELFTSSIGIVQVGVFFAIPLLATGSLVKAYRTYSWKDQRRTEAIRRLQSAKRRAQSQRRRMEADLQQLPLEKVENISPQAVRDATTIKTEFLEECDSVFEEAEDRLINAEHTDVSLLERSAQSLEQQAEALHADEAVSELEDTLRGAINSVVDEQFNNTRTKFTSSYGDRYKTANLSEDLRSVTVPGTAEQIVISTTTEGEIAEQLHNAIAHNELDVSDAIDLIDAVDTQIHDEILPHLQESEAMFRDIETRVEDNLSRAAQKIADIDGHTGVALKRIFVTDTENEETDSARTIREKLKRGRNRLHACELEGAIDDVETAEHMSEEYMETVQFICNVLIPSIERERSRITSVPHPGSSAFQFFTEAFINRLREPIRNDYGADINLDLDTSEITVEYDISATVDDSPVETESVETGPRDSVKYLIKEFQSSAGEGNVPSEGTLGIDSLPQSVQNANPVPEFVEFIESVDNLEIVDYPHGIENDNSESEDRTENDGYLSIRSAEGEPIARITDDLVEQYRTWATHATRAD